MRRRHFIFFTTLTLILVISLYNFFNLQKTLPKPSLQVIGGSPKVTVPTKNTRPTPRKEPSPLPTKKPTPRPTPIDTPQAAISVYYDENWQGRILYSKQPDKVLPIASITKLVTAIAVKKFFPKDTEITISQNAISESEDAGHLKIDEIFSRDELLYPLLIESSNDAAYAFAETAGIGPFMTLMNDVAKSIGMTKTFFVNANGLDDKGGNTSTARDLAVLGKYLLRNYPELLEITRQKEYHLSNSDGSYDYNLKNTNALLSDESFKLPIIGGKTGTTAKALQALLLITQAPNDRGYIVTVVLRSTDRYKDIQNVLDKALKSYSWST